MTITASTVTASALFRFANGSHLDDAGGPAAASIDLGFNPRYVRVENSTDGILLEWYYGMTSAHAIKTIANGTRSVETSGGITVSGDTIGFAPTQNKTYRWIAMG